MHDLKAYFRDLWAHAKESAECLGIISGLILIVTGLMGVTAGVMLLLWVPVELIWTLLKWFYHKLLPKTIRQTSPGKKENPTMLSPQAFTVLRQMATEHQGDLLELVEECPNQGICVQCGNVQSGVEPDAEGYPCEVCGEPAVAGMEVTLLYYIP